MNLCLQQSNLSFITALKGSRISADSDIDVAGLAYTKSGRYVWLSVMCPSLHMDDRYKKTYCIAQKTK